MRSSPLLALLVLLTAGGCNHTYPNPFAAQERSQDPSAGAALLFTSSAWATQPGSGREIFSANADGSAVTRLTYCNDANPCDTIEAAIASDRNRTEVRRITGAATGPALIYLDLQRAAQASIIPASQQVSGIDWSPQGDVIVFSALRGGAGAGGPEDLYRVDPDGQNSSDLTCSQSTGLLACDATVKERRPRIDPTGNVAVYEHIDPTGLGAIFVFENTASKVQLTSGGTPGPPLPGTPYIVGSDADPAYSPDGLSVAFRRLTGLGQNGLGTWDIMTIHADGTAPTVVATGPLFRGAPDWGTPGLVFAETDTAAGTTTLVLVQPDGSGRRALVTQGAAFNLSFPRWLPGSR